MPKKVTSFLYRFSRRYITNCSAVQENTHKWNNSNMINVTVSVKLFLRSRTFLSGTTHEKRRRVYSMWSLRRHFVCSILNGFSFELRKILWTVSLSFPSLGRNATLCSNGWSLKRNISRLSCSLRRDDCWIHHIHFCWETSVAVTQGTAKLLTHRCFNVVIEFLTVVHS